MGLVNKPLAALLACSMLLVACGSTSGGGHADESIRELTVLLQSSGAGSWPSGLDPATNATGGANISMMNAIFGGLFQLRADADGKNPRVEPVLAAGYEMADAGQTMLIKLRGGVTFSDGTPLDAEALRYNILRNLNSNCTCAPTRWPWSSGQRVTVVDSLTVALHFSRPYPAAVHVLPSSNLNWPVSPTAAEGTPDAEFRVKPVGAGPFKVIENVLSARLSLEKNPHYWEEGRPRLDRLTFLSIASEQAAYLALRAGDAEVAEGITSPRLANLVEKEGQIHVMRNPSTSTYFVQFNTKVSPFDDQRAREAVYYATDVKAIVSGLIGKVLPISQTFTAPGGLYYYESIPGYRAYDPERARALVREIGGIDVTLITAKDSLPEQIVTALQTQWTAVGMNVQVQTLEVATTLQAYQAGDWQVALQRIGSFDPDAGIVRRFRSTESLSGVADAALDEMLERAGATLDSSVRGRLYLDAATLVSERAYALFLFPVTPVQLVSPGVTGPGLTSPVPPALVTASVLWQEVARSKP
jgi:peptide/nickel transport system substrate-binding protein